MTAAEKQRRLTRLIEALSRGRRGDREASELLARFGSYGRALAAHPSALKTSGLTDAEALLIATLPALARRVALEAFGPAPRLGDDEALCAYVRALYTGVSREKLTLCCLSAQGALVGRYTVAEGTDAALSFQPRQLAELAIRSGAPKVVLCHNHPHGREAFSEADIQTTRAAVGYLRAMDIELSDHLLVTGGAVISMRRSGPAGRLVFDDRA